MLNVLIGNVGVNMPGKRREKKSEGTELRSRIETTLRSIVADRNRMSGYKKVVKAAKKQKEEEAKKLKLQKEEEAKKLKKQKEEEAKKRKKK